jgi:hypothetical protein
MASGGQVISSLFLKEFVSPFFLSMRYFFAPEEDPKLSLREGSPLAPLPRRTCIAPLSQDEVLIGMDIRKALEAAGAHVTATTTRIERPRSAGNSMGRHLCAAKRKCQGRSLLSAAARSLAVDQSSRRNKRDDRLGEVQALIAMGRPMLRSPLSIPGQRVGALTQVRVGPSNGRYQLVASNYCSVPVAAFHRLRASARRPRFATHSSWSSTTAWQGQSWIKHSLTETVRSFAQ